LTLLCLYCIKFILLQLGMSPTPTTHTPLAQLWFQNLLYCLFALKFTTFWIKVTFFKILRTYVPPKHLLLGMRWDRLCLSLIHIEGIRNVSVALSIGISLYSNFITNHKALWFLSKGQTLLVIISINSSASFWNSRIIEIGKNYLCNIEKFKNKF
jgi:hypothetical protein